LNNSPERQKELAINIADFLSDWLNDTDENTPFEESIETIESYGDNVSFDSPNEFLVKAAIRHLIYTMNLMNKATVPDTLVEIAGFTNEEATKYYNELYDGWW
jgi:hypothetical protein